MNTVWPILNFEFNNEQWPQAQIRFKYISVTLKKWQEVRWNIVIFRWDLKLEWRTKLDGWRQTKKLNAIPRGSNDNICFIYQLLPRCYIYFLSKKNLLLCFVNYFIFWASHLDFRPIKDCTLSRRRRMARNSNINKNKTIITNRIRMEQVSFSIIPVPVQC